MHNNSDEFFKSHDADDHAHMDLENQLYSIDEEKISNCSESADDDFVSLLDAHQRLEGSPKKE